VRTVESHPYRARHKRVGESAKAEAAEVSAEFEGLEDVAADSGGEEFTDDGGADGG
jgi:hypothetical protein